MDDAEERPSKIRKLSPPEDPEAQFQSLSETTNGSSTTPHNPTLSELRDEHISETKAKNLGEGEETEQRPALSKSQLKKLRKKEQWEAGKDDRRLKRREKHKEKQARKATARAELAAQTIAGEMPCPNPESVINGQQKVKGRGPKRPIQVPLALILDCDFNDLMTEKELISLGAQLTRCYSENRSAVYRSHLAVSSWGGSLQERFEGPLSKNHLGWKGVRFIPENFVAAAGELNEVMRGPEGGKAVVVLKGEEVQETEAPISIKEQGIEEKDAIEVPLQNLTEVESTGLSSKDIDEPKTSNVVEGHPPSLDSNVTKDLTESAPESSEPKDLAPPRNPIPPPSLIYLTSDSPHTLNTLSPHTSYIIGGIVDKNRHKGLCYKRAKSLGIPTAKLPIGEYMTMQSRSVLAVNHVVEIMLRWLETGDWGEAFLRVIPKRKEATLKKRKGEDGEVEDVEGDSEDEEDIGDSIE